MCCRILELRDKQVICIKDGTIVGTVCDLLFDTGNGKIISLVIYGKPRFFGIFGRHEDVIIPWDKIEIIGEDSILVNFEPQPKVERSRKFLPF